MSTSNSVPYYQHQNLTKEEGVQFKYNVYKCLHNVPHTIVLYWCYCASFIDKVYRYNSKVALYNKSSIEVKHRNTIDINIFCFP